MKEQLVYPTFLYVGAGKSGSSWIFECLREHPDIFVPIPKDLKYFDVGYERGQSFENYLGYFGKGGGNTAVGELSHDYFLKEEFAERIRTHLPDIKIIACLREPGSLIISAFNYSSRPEKQYGLQHYYTEWYQPKGKLAYLRNLHFFYERFPSQNILVLFFDDLVRSPEKFIFELYKFLGVDPNYKPRVLNQRVNPARKIRFNSPIIHRLGYLSAQIFRRYGLAKLIGLLKRNRLFVFLFFKQGKRTPIQDIGPDVLAGIRIEARKTYKELETLIGKKIPEDWYRA